MPRYAKAVLAFIFSIGLVVAGYAPGAATPSSQQGELPAPDPNCTPDGHQHLYGQDYPAVPNGLEPEFPVWCYPRSQPGAPTRIDGPNDWDDTWDNPGPGLQDLVDGTYDYRVHEVFYGGPFKWTGFIRNDHWMFDFEDVSPYNLSGGLLVSPNRSFHFENGKFVVEVDAAPGSNGMGGASHFYEIDITPAATTADHGVDSLYGYGSFSGFDDPALRQYAMGVRLEGGNFVVAMYDNSARATDGRCTVDDNLPVPPTRCSTPEHSGRVWETQGVGTARTATSVQGGYLDWLIPNSGGLHVSDVMRICNSNTHDFHCRDTFRVELTRDSIHVFVNGYLAMAIDGLYAVNPDTGADNRIPLSWLDPDGIGVRPYFTSWINGGQHEPGRWHWNRVRVNPHNPDGSPAAPAHSISYCLGNTFNGSPNTCPHGHTPGLPEDQAPGAATSTPTPVVATSTPTPTPTPGATNTPSPTPTPTTAATNTPTPTPTPNGQAQTITFDSTPHPNIGAFSGQYPSGVIDWGINKWYYSGPYAQFSTNSIGFNGPTFTSQTFNFVNPKVLVSVQADNGASSGSSVVTLSCGSNSVVSSTIPAHTVQTLTTNWNSACTTVTVTSGNGWHTNFDNLVYR